MSTHLLAIAEELADRDRHRRPRPDAGRRHARASFAMQVQHRGPLEELFLKLTGDHRRRPTP